MNPKLVVMLTSNDLTVKDAAETFESCKNVDADYWGFKEKPLDVAQMKELCSMMKAAGKTVFLEVVAYSEAEGLEGAQIAVECNCDILMGTKFHDSINEYCKAHELKYMPFVGTVEGRPSVLEGSIDGMIAEAKSYLEKGVYGIDLLGYRYTGNPLELNKRFVSSIDAPVCIAGSVDSYDRLDELKKVGPWAFTIGSAFFEHKFGEDISTQIENVCQYIDKNEVVRYYDTIADNYDESRFNNSYGRFIDAEERKILNQLIDVNQHTSRLEMACGTGRLTNYATHGLDASNEMLNIARKRHSKIEFRHASATQTGYEDGCFDIVYSFHLLMHLDQQTIKDIFAEANRILRPDGRLIVDIPSAERRNLLHHKQTSWHGATHLSKQEISDIAGDKFVINRSFGIMMFPVHHLPESMRRLLQKLDYALANGWLKRYSSYIVYEFIKK